MEFSTAAFVVWMVVLKAMFSVKAISNEASCKADNAE